MQKGLGQVSQLAQLLQSLGWLVSETTWEASAERDGSKVPARLAAWVKEGAAILADMVTEETSEAMAALQPEVDAIPMDATVAQDLEKAALAGDMAKAGARNSKADLSRIQAVHDHACALGAACADTGGLPSMVKVAGELAIANSALMEARGEVATMQKRIADLEKTPAPGGPVLRPGSVSVSKTNDQAGKLPDRKAELDELAAIQALPEGLDKTTALVRHSLKFSSH